MVAQETLRTRAKVLRADQFWTTGELIDAGGKSY
jgi:hypothetical protein